MPESDRAQAASVVLGDGGRSEELLAQLARITELARRGEWQRIEGLLGRINATVAGPVTSTDRDGLIAARAAVERVMALATAARNEIGEKLTGLRHGRRAMATYRAAGSLRGR